MDTSLLLDTIWIAIHLAGLLTAWSIRRHMSGYKQALAEGSFFALLPLIALLTILGEVFCMTLWPLSAATLGAMIVTAVVDFGTSNEGEPENLS